MANRMQKNITSWCKTHPVCNLNCCVYAIHAAFPQWHHSFWWCQSGVTSISKSRASFPLTRGYSFLKLPDRQSEASKGFQFSDVIDISFWQAVLKIFKQLHILKKHYGMEWPPLKCTIHFRKLQSLFYLYYPFWKISLYPGIDYQVTYVLIFVRWGWN